MTERIAAPALASFTFDDGTDSNDCAVTEVLDTPHLQVFAETPLTTTEARTLENRVERAATYGDSLQRWDDDAQWHSKLTATLLSDRCMRGLTGVSAEAVPGVTTGPDDIFLRRKTLRGNSSLDAEVLAHELVHIQDWRMAREAEPELPLYLKEGKAYVVGLRYAANRERVRQVRDDLSRMTGDQARWVVEQFRTSHPAGNPNASYLGELGGAMFVEYLSAHVKPSALVKLANAIEAAGQGKEFEAQFKKQFGVSLAAAEAAFVRFIEQTEGRPAARFKGTLFNG